MRIGHSQRQMLPTRQLPLTHYFRPRILPRKAVIGRDSLDRDPADQDDAKRREALKELIEGRAMPESFLLPKPSRSPALTDFDLDEVFGDSQGPPREPEDPYRALVAQLKEYHSAGLPAHASLSALHDLLVDPLRSKSAPTYLLEEGVLPVLCSILRVSADGGERCAAAEVMASVFQQASMITVHPVGASVCRQSWVSAVRFFSLSTTDLHLAATSLATCFARHPTPAAGPTAAQRGLSGPPAPFVDSVQPEMYHRSGAASQPSAAVSDMERLGLGGLGLTPGPNGPRVSTMDLGGRPGGPGQDGGSRETAEAEIFYASVALGRLSSVAYPQELAGDVIASFSSADVFHRLTYILQQRPPTSDTAFAAVYALKQLVSMRPQPARRMAGAHPGPSEFLSRLAVEAGVIPRALTLIATLLEEKKQRLDAAAEAAAAAAQAADPDWSPADHPRSPSPAPAPGPLRPETSVLKAACGVIDTMLETQTGRRAFLSENLGLHCLLLLVALAEGSGDQDTPAAALRMLARLAQDGESLADVVRSGAVSVVLKYLADDAAPQGLTRLHGRAHAIEFLQHVCRDESLMKHLIVQPSLARVISDVLKSDMAQIVQAASAASPSPIVRLGSDGSGSDEDVSISGVMDPHPSGWASQEMAVASAVADLKVAACGIVQRIALTSAVYAQHLCERHVAEPLISLAREANAGPRAASRMERRVQAAAVAALRNMATHAELQSYLVASGAVPPLVEILAQAGEALRDNFHIISTLDSPGGDSAYPPHRTVPYDRAELVMPVATEVSLQTCNMLGRTHAHIRSQLLRSNLVASLVAILRFGPSPLRFQALDTLLLLAQDAEGYPLVARSGLMTEAVGILETRPSAASPEAATIHRQLCVRACLALATLATDPMTQSKSAALGAIPAVCRFLAESADNRPTPGLHGLLAIADAEADPASKLRLGTARHSPDILRHSRVAAVSALKALCRGHPGNHQELLRCLVLEGWIGGANLDISPDDQYMGGGMPPHFGL